MGNPIKIPGHCNFLQGQRIFLAHKWVGEDAQDVWELRWKNGRRVYFAHIPEKKVLLLLGGNKNGQDKDIRKAKSLLKKYAS